jgi:uncharacterized protein YerC
MAKSDSNSVLRNQFEQMFAQLLVDLRSKDEAKVFLSDFFKPDEIKSIVKRLGIIYLLSKGRDKSNIKNNIGTTNQEIIFATKIINKSGIRLIIKKIESEEFAAKWSERIRKIVRV